MWSADGFRIRLPLSLSEEPQRLARCHLGLVAAVLECFVLVRTPRASGPGRELQPGLYGPGDREGGSRQIAEIELQGKRSIEPGAGRFRHAPSVKGRCDR